VLEASTKPCPHCEGTGLMRTASSAGLSALRLIEDEAARGRGAQILLRAGRDAAVYLLNKKRSELAEIEERYGVFVEVMIDDAFEGAKMAVESSGPRPQRVIPAPSPAEPEDEDEEQEEELEAALGETEESEDQGEEEGEGNRQGRKRRRRRRGGRNRRRGSGEPAEGAVLADEVPPPLEEALPEAQPKSEDVATTDKPKRRRRRRGSGGKSEESTEAETIAIEIAPDSSPMVERPVDEEPPIAEAETEPKPRKGGRRKKVVEPVEVASEEAAPRVEPEEKPKRRTRRTKIAEAAQTDAAELAESAPSPSADNDSTADEDGEPRRGWWQRTFG